MFECPVVGRRETGLRSQHATRGGGWHLCSYCILHPFSVLPCFPMGVCGGGGGVPIANWPPGCFLTQSAHACGSSLLALLRHLSMQVRHMHICHQAIRLFGLGCLCTLGSGLKNSLTILG